MRGKSVLVTGAAGFIGFHLSKKLVNDGWRVIGVDNMNSYYDVSLKKARLNGLLGDPLFEFIRLDISNNDELLEHCREGDFQYVINLAAQAGVRYSLENPQAYLDSNIQGFLNMLELCRMQRIEHLIYASSSSVYGANTLMPFSVSHNVDHPLSLYAATKKANELMAHTYSNLYNLPTTGLRFFTVYGPYGRPDMALFIFTKAILEGRPINVYNHGKMKRDFTYVDDIVSGIIRLITAPPVCNENWNRELADPATSFAPYQLFNIGNNNPVGLLNFIEVLEEKLGKKAVKNFLPMQLGDVEATYADVDPLKDKVDFKPSTSISEGVGKFVDWYLDYYKVKI